MVDLTRLKEITEDIAKEVERHENGEIFNLLKLILDNIDTLSLIVDKDSNILYFNKAESDYFKKFGIKLRLGTYLYENILGKGASRPDWCPIQKCIDSKQIEIVELDRTHTKYNHKFIITAIPLVFNGVSGAILFTKVD